MYGRILLRINLSRILLKNGRRLIGRKEEDMSGGLFGFGTRIVTENFQSMGK